MAKQATVTVDRKREIALGYFALLYGAILFFLLLDNLFWYIRYSQAYRFIYMFTNQANLLMMLWLFLFGITRFIKKDTRAKRFATHHITVAAVTLYMTIVFLVVVLVLFAFYRSLFADHLVGYGVWLFTHLISIIIMHVFFFLVRTGAVRSAWLVSVYLLIYPLLFLAMSFIIGFTTDAFPYDFLDPHFYPHIAVYVVSLVGLATAFWAIGFLILLLQRYLWRNLGEKNPGT